MIFRRLHPKRKPRNTEETFSFHDHPRHLFRTRTALKILNGAAVSDIEVTEKAIAVGNSKVTKTNLAASPSIV
jgi:hypothetical protein